MLEEYITKVYKIAEVKYALDEEIMEAFQDTIEYCWKENFMHFHKYSSSR